MNGFKLTVQEGDRWAMGGEVDLYTLPQVWRRLEALIRTCGRLTLSLSTMGSNSATLVLLLQALDLAGKVDCDLRYTNIPDSLRALAGISNVQAILDGSHDVE